MNAIKHECPKCSGKGIIEAFRHINNGNCYACGGTGSGNYKKSQKNEINNPIKKTKTVNIHNEICMVIPYGTMLKIAGNTGMVLIDWESAKNGTIKIVAISDGWQKLQKKRIEEELLKQIKVNK